MAVGQTLAKATRTALGEASVRDACLRAFAVQDPSLAETLSRKDFWHILDAMRAIRTEVSHGGIGGPAQQQTRLGSLEAGLHDLRGPLTAAFGSVDMVQPGASRYDGGVHRFSRARRLVGSNAIFVERSLISLRPLEADDLFIVDQETEAAVGALQLVPLIRLGPAPESDRGACYFFSSRDRGGEFHFKSFHYEGQPESTLHDDTLSELFSELDPDS